MASSSCPNQGIEGCKFRFFYRARKGSCRKPPRRCCLSVAVRRKRSGNFFRDVLSGGEVQVLMELG